MAMKYPAPLYDTTVAFDALVRPPASEGETPVMDRASPSSQASQTYQVSHRGHVNTSGSGFNKRDDKDRRPGTRVPFHEPDPDRLAKAEALRQAILVQEQRRGGIGAYAHKPIKPKAPAHRYYGATVSSLPDVPVAKVRTGYACREEDASVRGERDGVVLFFKNGVRAQAAMTGVRENNGKNIANAAAGITRGAYGWSWSRLKRSRTGPPPSLSVRGRGGK